MKSLADILPAMFLEADADGSLSALISSYDNVQQELVGEIEALPDVVMPNRTPLAFAENVADRYGNPFHFLTPSRLKDKLGSFISVYQRRGTKAGIIAVCFYFCGVIPEIVEDFEWGWRLGVSTLQINTRLSDGTSPLFWVKTASSVPQTVRDEMSAVINFMKPSNSQWRFVLVDGIVPVGDLHTVAVVSEFLQIEGWAASFLQGAPVAWVDVQLDGTSIGHADLDEVTVRNDVQAYMVGHGGSAGKDYTHSQFTFSTTIGNIETGDHVVTVIATQYDGQVGVVGTQNIHI